MRTWTEVIRLLETRLNWQILPGKPDSTFWSLFESEGSTLSAPPKSLRAAAGKKTDLLVALTTYNRPESCARIVAALPDLLEAAGRPLDAHVIVVKDAGGADYDAVADLARDRLGERLTWLEARSRLGKEGFWKVHQTLFLAARVLRPHHALYLQDDLDFSRELLRDCYAHFDALVHDGRLQVLNLFASEDDEPGGRWIQFARKEGVAPGLRLTQWFDLAAFFAGRSFFELLRYRVFPVPERRWQGHPTFSSGVGEQLTHRLFGRGNVYQAMPPLVFHGTHGSEMNPEARAEQRMDNRLMAGTKER